jgi:hypothetical protein
MSFCDQLRPVIRGQVSQPQRLFLRFGGGLPALFDISIKY